MTRLNHNTDQVSIVTLLNKDLSADDAIAVRTTGGVYDTKEDYLFIGRFAGQPKEHVVSDNFPYASIELNEMWNMKSGTATSLDSFPEQCILHPHRSAAVKVRVGYESESAESYRTIGVVSDYEVGDIATPRSLLTEEETIR